MSATQAAVVLDALVATLTTALEGVQVVDGQPVGNLKEKVVTVGYAADRLAVEVEQAREDMRGLRRSDRLTIACLASVSRGGVAMSSVREDTVALLTAVQEALDADRKLGGAVLRAELGMGMALDQAQTKDGASATVSFDIIVTTV